MEDGWDGGVGTDIGVCYCAANRVNVCGFVADHESSWEGGRDGLEKEAVGMAKEGFDGDAAHSGAKFG